MNLEALLPTPADGSFPPLMPWRQFADWIREEHTVVRGWVDKGHLPCVKVGRRRLVNLVALVEQLRDAEI